MLFTDSDVATPALCLSLDPECQAALASGSKTGQPALLLDQICSQAWSECRSKLEASLASFSTFVGVAGMQAHIGAVLNTGGWYGGNGTRPRLRLNQIIVSDTYYANSISPIQRWVTYSALMLLFQTMSNRLDSKDKTGDRFEKKRAFYERERDRWWSMVLSQGMPFVLSYLDRPGSTHGYNAGTWDNTALSLVPGMTVYTQPVQAKVAITYVDQTSYVSPLLKNNAESAPSDTLSMFVEPNQQLNVSIAALNPPNINQPPPLGISQPVVPMRGATGWNIYVGQGNGPLYLQTVNAPIPISMTNYTLVVFDFASPTIGPGQFPEGGGNALVGGVIQRS